MLIETNPMSIRNSFALMTIGILFLWSCAKKESGAPDLGIEHVVVIGFDGLSPDGLENATTPNFDRLMHEGSYTMNARAVLPSSSSPNWASMIMGAGPEQHGITSNAWETDNFVLPAVAQGEDFLFPTIFRLIDSQVENAEVGAIYHWGGFGRLFEKNAVDFDSNPKTEEETATVASEYIKSKSPNFTFIHFDHIDHAGHEFGHGSKEYYESVEKGDILLGMVVKSIYEAGIAGKTLVLISADHGGLGKGHGGESLKEVEIPFIVWGKSIKKGHSIKYPVYQYDNAATVAFALGLKTPNAWIGKPVKSVFVGYGDTDEYPIFVREREPIILPKGEGFKKAGGLFDESASVIIENPGGEGVVRYTLDGTMPNAMSSMADTAFLLTENTIVKSAVFKKGKISSTVSEAYFRIKGKADQKPIDYEIFYLDNLTSVPSLEGKEPAKKGLVFEITSDEIMGEIKSNTAVRFTTTIDVSRKEIYTFYTRSDDGSILRIDNNLIVDNDGDHGVLEKNGKAELEPGKHSLEVIWFNGGGDGWLDVFVETDKLKKQILPTTMLKAK